MIKDLLFKLTITSLVSGVIGVCLHPFTGFWSGFGLGFAFQIIINYLYINFVALKLANESDRILNERVDMLTKNSVSFPCPCGNNMFEEIILLQDDNIFVCRKCNQSVRLSVILTPTVVTTPLDNETQLQKLSQIKPEEEIQ